MDQDHSAENGPKEASSKPSGGTKTMNGRGGSMGSGMAMKIPGKQPNKNTQVAKKGRPGKSSTKDGLSSNSATPDLPNGGNSQLKISREGRRNAKEDKMPNRLSPSLGNQNRNVNSSNRSRGNSRNNSTSPVNRMDNGDANDKRTPVSSSASAEADKNNMTDNLKQLLSIGGNQTHRIIYSRIQLLNISENPSSKHRPECLDIDFNASNGRWDPETWHRSLSPTSLPSASERAERIHRLSLSESRDRFADDSTQGGIILGPQRRSFQDGCHVTNSAASRLSSKHHLPSPTEPGRHARPRLVLRQRSEADFDSSPSQNRERQIESASALRTEEFDWERRGDSRFRERDLSDLRPEPRSRRELPRDLHELRSEYARDHREGEYRDRDRDRDFRDRRFSHNNSREYGGGWYNPRERRERRFSNNEPEPEWYTDGPSSKNETMELAGFEEETPAAAADFSSWGGEIPMDDLDFPEKKEKKKEEEEDENNEEKETDALEGEKLEEAEKPDDTESKESSQKNEDQTPEDTAAIKPAPETQDATDDISEMDFNDLLGIPGFSAVMEQILKENSVPLPTNEDKTSTENQPSSSSSSRFSQWFQKDQAKNESGSGVSTPHEELENLAELAAERGLASPVDVESKQQQQYQQPMKADIMRLLTQRKSGGSAGGSGSSSPSLKQDSLEQQQQQELARRLLMMKGSVMSAAEIEAKAGARQSPSQSYGGVDMQNTDAFNKLVASIREKDKIRQRQQIMAQQQQQAMNQFPGKANMNIPGGRIPSPEELAAHTQNIFQQALIKKQLEKQKDAYREKVRQIEQQRREEQLREAIRSADAKMQESKQMNKSLAFMPTSVMRKMQESRDGKISGDDMVGQQMMPGDADDLASATASFSAKLASKKMNSNPMDPMHQQGNDLLARIYQSAASGKPNRSDAAAPGLRRNASYPEILMDANKLGRSSAFQPPMQRSFAANSLDLSKLNISGDSETQRLRNMLQMQQPSKPTAMKSGNIEADIYNNNMLKAENQAAKYDRSSPASMGAKLLSEQMEKTGNDTPDAELKNQHEVALLTQFVLNKFGITEDQLSRLTPQQQQVVVNVVQEQYYLLQAQKRRLAMEKKAQKDAGNPHRLKQGDLPPPNAAKQHADLQAAMAGKNAGKMDQNDPRSAQVPHIVSMPKPTSTAQTPNSMSMKFAPNQQQAGIPGLGLHGLLPTTNPQLHPLQLRSLVHPGQPMQFIPPPMTRPPMMPTAFLPPQAHIPGRFVPPPPNVPLASPLGAQYPAAALMQMQLYQQQQQQRALLAAAIQQQQMQALQAAARQQQANKENRGGEFSNPLERWFGPDVLSHSPLPPPPQQKTMTLTDIERANQNNKQE